MLNLLAFEYRRLGKSLFFKIIGGYCILWPLLVAGFYRLLFELVMRSAGLTFQDFEMSRGELRYITWMLSIAFVNELPKFIALFTVLHIGRDFSDGIVRNKIIAGHSRTAIFFSYLITQMSATVLMCVTYIGAALLGLTISGIGVDLNHGEMFSRLGVGIVVLLVLTVTFTVVSLMFRKRTLPIIISIVVVMVMSTATAVVGYFNLPAKAVDEYIEIRHERYEDLVDDGILTDDVVEDLEDAYDKDSYLSIPWKVCHPAYLLTNLGFNGDYDTDILQMIMSLNLEYKDEIDFSDTFVSDYYSMDMSGLTTKDLKHADSIHVTYSELNIIYVARSVAYMLVIGGWGYFIFRKKNLY